MTTPEPPREESSVFVRPPRKRDWRIIGIRIGVIVALAVLFFVFILRPTVVLVDGAGAEPPYSGGKFTFVFRPYFNLHSLERKRKAVFLAPLDRRADSGERSFLKRIIALPGETVEIRGGVVYVNGEALDEPYVRGKCDWDCAPRTVPEGKLFVLGDDRSMSMQNQRFGMIDRNRLAGVPVW